jgi:hypothetical protein
MDSLVAFPALFISSLPEEASFIRLLKNGPAFAEAASRRQADAS